MATSRFFPLSDSGPNVQTPVPDDGVHHSKVDEFPNNGDTDYLNVLVEGFEVFTTSATISGSPESQIKTVDLLWATTQGVDGHNARVGIRVGGVNFWAPTRSMLPSGPTYSTFVEPFPLDPRDGSIWTIAKLAEISHLLHQVTVIQQALPPPRFSSLTGRIVTSLAEKEWSGIAFSGKL